MYLVRPADENKAKAIEFIIVKLGHYIKTIKTIKIGNLERTVYITGETK